MEERMTNLEQSIINIQDVLLKISEGLVSGPARPTELRGPPPKGGSDEAVERLFYRHPTDAQQSSPAQPGATSKFYPKAAAITPPQAPPDPPAESKAPPDPQVQAKAPPEPPAEPKATTLSPAYQVPEDGVI